MSTSFPSARGSLPATSYARGIVGSRNGITNDLSRIGHILIADEDAEMREMVTGYFAGQGFPSCSASSRREVDQHFGGRDPCLIVLDLQLGLDLLRSIRARSDVPIIITSDRPDEIDRIVGLELGADDYIVKPYTFRELLARVRAVLRRQEMARASLARDPERGGYMFSGWRLDRRSRAVVDAHETPVSLSKSEYALLLAFVEAPGRPLTREQLLQATRIHEDIFDRSVDVQVFRLRRKLEVDPKTPSMIQTVYGVGYVFAAVVEPF